MQPSADIVIIGAGVIGCSTAYHLAQMGITNTVIVEMGQPGSGSTSKSACMLSLQFSADELGAHGATRLCALHGIRAGNRRAHRLPPHRLAFGGHGQGRAALFDITPFSMERFAHSPPA